MKDGVDPESPSFADLLRGRRTALGLTQEELAERAGLSPRGVLYLERGARQPYRDTVRRLGQALRLTPQQQEVLAAAARWRRVPPATSTSSQSAAGEQHSTQQMPDDSPYRLPTPPTSLLGRERELAAATALLQHDDLQILTLTGPGGVGKTRLALEVAAQVRRQFADGVVFVSLAPLADTSLVLLTIAQALELSDRGGQPLSATLTTFLQHKRLMMVLDNFEHVLDAAAEVAGLRSACPGLRVLVTSRAALRVRGERLFDVRPLALPTLSGRPEADGLLHIPAVSLFVQRARAMESGFTLNAANAAAIAAICVRLDGLPLAIELAAARVRELPPEALAAQLAQPLRVLISGPRDVPARHRTLRTTIEWSYRLLSPAAQAMFRRLAVLAEGFTLAAATAVCSTDGGPPQEASLEELSTLVDMHLVHRIDAVPGGDPQLEARYGMLDTIREYGRERLADAGETERVRCRHMSYFLDLAEEATPHFWRAGQLVWLDRFERELGNLRLALAYCVERSQAGDAEAGERGLYIAGRLSQFWLLRASMHEGLMWLEQLLQTGPAAARTAARAWALFTASALVGNSGNTPLAHVRGEECVAIFRELDDPWNLAAGLDVLAYIRACYPRPGSGDLATVRSCRDELLPLFEQAGDRDGLNATMIGASYLWSGMAALRLGDLAGAADELAYSLAATQAVGDRFFANLALEALARLAQARGDLAGARAYLEQALTGAEALGDQFNLTIILCSLGDVARIAGHEREAKAYYVEALRGVVQLGHVRVCDLVLCGLAELAMARGDAASALRLASASGAVARTAGATASGGASERLERVESAARRALPPHEQTRAWTAGQLATLQDVLADELHAVGNAAVLF